MSIIWKVLQMYRGVKKALIARDFIDADGDIISFSDPFFKLWIKRNIAQL